MKNLMPLLRHNRDGELVIHCPACSHSYTHVENSLIFKGEKSEDSIAGLVAGTSGEDRGRVSMRIRCEAGHHFLLHFQQHKGQTIVKVEITV